jgi:hypothetical protein
VLKLLAAISLTALLAVRVMATAQAPDMIVYDNKVYDLFSNPLESFYRERGGRPQFRIQPNTFSSGNQRGYVAIWVIEDDALYLRGIKSRICDPDAQGDSNCRRADLKELFGEKSKGAGVHADWFSGELRIPEGEMLEYVHGGYASVFERDIILKVEAGKVVGRTAVDNTKSKKHEAP